MLYILLIVESPTATSPDYQIFKNIDGTIFSPNYPKKYGNKQQIYYRITPPKVGEIVLIFKHFDLEYSDGCYYDFLQVNIKYY